MKTGIRVADVMTEKPIIVDSGQSITDCAKVMRVNKVGALLVQDKEHTLIGIATEKDFVRKIIADELDPSEELVSTVVSKNFQRIDPNQDIFDAMVLMRDFNIRHLPVMQAGEFLGLLTSKDILKIEPQLFELLVDTIELREEERKVRLLEEEADSEQ